MVSALKLDDDWSAIAALLFLTSGVAREVSAPVAVAKAREGIEGPDLLRSRMCGEGLQSDKIKKPHKKAVDTSKSLT